MGHTLSVDVDRSAFAVGWTWDPRAVEVSGRLRSGSGSGGGSLAFELCCSSLLEGFTRGSGTVS